MKSLSLLVVLLVSFTNALAQVNSLPNGMVYLAAVAPDIRQDMRYAGANNFTGKPVTGYQAGECILGSYTASQLAKVYTALRSNGYGLLILDCYRPMRAVKSFVAWARKSKETGTRYHPRVLRFQLVKKGYIGSNSTHSSGASVDLALTKLSADGNWSKVDMGTIFDYFDKRSHTNSPAVSNQAAENRKRLVEAMKKQGFSNYHREWWHFTHPNEPLRSRRFDFAIQSRF